MLLSLSDFLIEISKLLKAPHGREKTFVIALDGRAAAGKSSLANVLAARFGAAIIHMDDFFLPAELRTPERFAEPGGNIHYERFARQVLPHLGKKQAFAYQKFNCQKMCLEAEIKIPASPIQVVEGAYCLRSEFQSAYDLKVFMTCSPEAQMLRIQQRNPNALESFKTRWIPMEEAYFKAFQIQKICGYEINTDNKPLV